jgi:hypothetical protein
VIDRFILSLPEGAFPWIDAGLIAVGVLGFVMLVRWRMRVVERKKIDAVLGSYAARPGFTEED